MEYPSRRKSFYKRRRKGKDILKGLLEEVRSLYKEVAPIKETYIIRLK